MDLRFEVIEFLFTPFTWAIAEVLAFVLFFYCLSDALKKSDGNTRLFRVLELFGFVLYAGIFENIGVITNVYNYSLDRLVMVGVVPLSLLLFEAVIFYSALQFAEVLRFPRWVRPFVVAFLGVLQDLTIDPAAVFDTHLVNGLLEGRWNWTTHYDGMLFGIPFFNFTGWFLLMFYYTSLIQIGRNFHEKSGYKYNRGMLYVLLSPLIGVLLIVSPITTFFLFLYPVFPMFINRTAEIVTLSSVMLITIGILIKHRKARAVIDRKDYPVIWTIPLILHGFDIILAFGLGITIAYIPVLLFASIHIGYLDWYLKRKPQSQVQDISSTSTKDVIVKKKVSDINSDPSK
ncbi:MAG: carotenoid biosynthesis protein [Candidatus Ranarchaeia archaeon]